MWLLLTWIQVEVIHWELNAIKNFLMVWVWFLNLITRFHIYIQCPRSYLQKKSKVKKCEGGCGSVVSGTSRGCGSAGWGYRLPCVRNILKMNFWLLLSSFPGYPHWEIVQSEVPLGLSAPSQSPMLHSFLGYGRAVRWSTLGEWAEIAHLFIIACETASRKRGSLSKVHDRNQDSCVISLSAGGQCGFLH